jgi:hypothetical protein
MSLNQTGTYNAKSDTGQVLGGVRGPLGGNGPPEPGLVEAAWCGGKGSLSGAMLVAILLYAGWDPPMYLNEETKAKAIIPGRAVFWSAAILGVIYAWLFVSLQGVMSPAELTAHATDALPYIAVALVGHGWARFMVAAVTLSVLGTTQATLVATSRITYAMGTDGLSPRRFGVVSSVSRRRWVPGCSGVWRRSWWWTFTSCRPRWPMHSTPSSPRSGSLSPFFWALTALATTTYYRRIVTRSVADFVLVGILPLGAAGTFGWIVSQQVPAMSTSGRWTILGLGIAGIALMAFSAVVVRALFFRTPRSSFEPTPSRSEQPG